MLIEADMEFSENLGPETYRSADLSIINEETDSQLLRPTWNDSEADDQTNLRCIENESGFNTIRVNDKYLV